MGPSGVDREKMELRHPNYSDFTMKSSGWVGNKAPKTWLVNIRKTQLTQGKIYGKHQETMIVTNKYKEGPVNCPTNSRRLELSLAGMTGYAPFFFKHELPCKAPEAGRTYIFGQFPMVKART